FEIDIQAERALDLGLHRTLMSGLRPSPENLHLNQGFCRRPSTAQGIYPQSAVDLDDAPIDAIDIGVRRIVAEESIALRRQVKIEWPLRTDRKLHRIPPAECVMFSPILCDSSNQRPP